MSRGLPPVVLLDLDDTILDDTGRCEECWQIACRQAAVAQPGLDAEGLRREIERAGDRFWSDPDRSRQWRLQMREAWGPIATEALAALGVDDPALGARIGEWHFEARDRTMTPLSGALEGLGTLRSRGTMLGLVTNGGSETQRAKIERFALAPYFDYIGIEGEVGVGKPDRRAYDIALHSLGATPGEAWMVGDSLERDVAGAQAAGIFGVWLDRYACGFWPEASRPDRVIHSLTELA